MPATLLLNDQLRHHLAAAVRAGVPVETACRAAGISPQQYYFWLQAAETGCWPGGSLVSEQSLLQIQAFAEDIARAKAGFEADHVAGIARAAEERNQATGVTDWRARAWLLNNHPYTRKTYRPERTTTIEQTGTVKHEHTLVKQLNPDELEAAYQALELEEGDASA